LVSISSEGRVLIVKLVVSVLKAGGVIGVLSASVRRLNTPRVARITGGVTVREENSLRAKRPHRSITHIAAPPHIDRAIHGSGDFTRTNVVYTSNLQESGRAFWIEVLPEETVQIP
jgi:dTDP-D-glucose 4,6-dehydratase